MNKVRLGVVGYGSMGYDHCANVFGGKTPKMEVTAICDISEERRNEAKEKYPDVAIFENATDLYKSGLCDAVIIAVPHYEHPRLMMEAWDNGLHAITEKPAGVYTKQVLEMNDAAKKTDKLYGIMYNQRRNPLYIKLREMIKNGELGHIKRVTWIITAWYRPQAYHDSAGWRSTWKTEGGGTLINQNPHQLDLWQWMFGMPDRITSHVSYGKYYDIEVEDDVSVFMEYNNGTTGTYITSTGEFPGTNRLEVACDRGKVVIEGNKMTFRRTVISEREFNEINKDPFGQPECWTCEIPMRGTYDAHWGILNNFADAILSGAELIAPGEEGIKGLTISNAIHLSSWTGKTVDVNNFPHDEFYDLLREKIKNSKVDKSHVKSTVNNVTGTY